MIRFARQCCILLAVALLMTGCTKPSAPADEIRIALNSNPLSMDPHYTNEVTSHILHSNIYDTLVEIRSDLTLSPALALRWNNPDDLTWIFDLAPNVRFHNGDPCTSEDVAYSLMRAKTDPASDWKGEMVSIDRVETPTPLRVVVRTSRPYPILLNRISSICIVPKKYIETNGRSALEKHPVGTGPYRFVSWDKGGALKLERWQGYYKQSPEVGKVTFEYVPEQAERVQKLLSGAIDLITDTPLQQSELARSPIKINQLVVAGLREVFLAFDMNRQNSPYLSVQPNPFLDPRVRMAFLQAIDTRRMIEQVLGGYAEPASQFGPPNVFGFDSELTRPPFNLENAQKLMKEAGYEKGFSVTLDSPQNVYFRDAEVADRVAASLHAINVDVKVNKVEKAVLFEKETSHDTSFYLLSWSSGSGDIEEVFDYLLHTPDPENGYGGDNGGRYSNPALDKMMDEASRTMDPGHRLIILKQAVNMAMKDVPWIPLYVQDDLYALNNRFVWDPPSDRNIRISQIKVRN